MKAIAADPAERFQSSLEMRRQLEKLHFPGFWSVDATGQAFGECGGYRFAFDLRPMAGGTFDLTCTRTNIQSGRTQRVTRFCKPGLSRQAAEAELRSFKTFVVAGT